MLKIESECPANIIHLIEEFKQLASKRTPMGELENRQKIDRLVFQNHSELMRNAHLAIQHPDVEIRQATLHAMRILLYSQLYKEFYALVDMNLVEALGTVALGQDEESSNRAISFLSTLYSCDTRNLKELVLRIQPAIIKASQSPFKETKRMADIILKEITRPPEESIEGTLWEGSYQGRRGSAFPVRVKFLSDSTAKVWTLGEYRDGQHEGEEFAIPYCENITWEQNNEVVDIIFDHGTWINCVHGEVRGEAISGQETKSDTGWYLKKKKTP